MKYVFGVIFFICFLFIMEMICSNNEKSECVKMNKQSIKLGTEVPKWCNVYLKGD